MKTIHIKFGKNILETIQRATAYARKNEAAFVELVRHESSIRQGESVKSHKRSIAKNEKRIAELDNLFKRTYEDFAAGRLSEKRFEQLSGGYETEQENLFRQIAELKAELEQFDNDTLRADKFLELARRYSDFSELTAPMLNDFIEKVYVHEADRSRGKRTQQVDVYLNFIGQFNVPEETTIPDDTDDEAKRAMWREYKRKQREKKKQAEQHHLA